MKILLTLTLMLCTGFVLAKREEMRVSGRRFVVISPDKKPTEKRPLLVLLHGCKQSPEIILEGTEFDKAAVARNFFVAAPEQTIFENIDHCWNWFLSHEQRRSSFNQMGQIIAGVKTLIEKSEVDPNQVYLAGISAGGVMGHNLASCYPDVFRGAALTAGLAFKIAENIFEASTVLDSNHFKSPNYLGKEAWECGKKGGQRKLDKMLMVHGEDDRRVDSFHSKLISDVNQVTLDYYDDGKKNDSIRFIQKTTQVSPLSAYPYSVRERQYKNIIFTERLILVKGLGHAWGGGKPISENFDPYAPSNNNFILNFFQL